MNFLPGWHPAFITGARLTTLTQVLSSTSTGQTITAPVGIQAGDLIVLLDRASTAFSIPSTVIPTDFNSIVNTTISSSDAVRQIASYKIANGTEGGTSLTGMDGGSVDAKEILVFRGNRAISQVSVSTPTSEGTGGNPSAQNIVASGGTPPLVALACYGAAIGQSVDPRTFTVGGSPAKDGEVSASNISYLAWKIYNSSPADIVIDMDDEGISNVLQGFYIQAS